MSMDTQAQVCGSARLGMKVEKLNMDPTLTSADLQSGVGRRLFNRRKTANRPPILPLVSITLLGTLLTGVWLSEIPAASQEPLPQRPRLGRPPSVESRFDELGAKVTNEGRVSVLVRLRASFDMTRLGGGGEGARLQQLAIAEVGQQLLTQLSSVPPESIKSYRYLPLLGVRVDAAGLEALRRSEAVLDLQEDQLLRPSLVESLVAIGAPAAWALGATGATQSIAIVDTGVDKAHPFLTGKVIAEACFSTSITDQSYFSLCPGGQPTATQSGAGLPCADSIAGCDHGTHVAGIAAGRGTLTSGVARDANLVAVQIFSRLDNSTLCNGAPSCLVAFTSDLVLALEHLYAQRDLYRLAAVNLSLGGARYENFCDTDIPGLKMAIDLLRSAGIPSIAASGNNGFSDALSAPACISSAISVGSIGEQPETLDLVSAFSNSAPFLSLLAPGEEISSSVPGGGYRSKMGTSMAVPHVSGAWALARQRVPSASLDDILLAIVNTGPLVTDPRNGVVAPRLRIDSALRALTGQDTTAVRPQAPVMVEGALTSPSQVTLTWTDRSDNEAGFRIRRRSSLGGQWVVMATVRAGVTTYRDDSVFYPESYAYTVAAFNSAGESIASNDARVGSPNQPPAPASDLQAVAVSLTGIDLSWRDNAVNEAGFLVQRQLNGSGPWELVASLGRDVQSYQDRGLRPGTPYRYRIIAFNLVGEAAPSSEVGATTWMGKQTRVQIEGAGNAIDFGRVLIGRPLEPPQSPLSRPTVQIENLTGSAASVLLRIQREGALVQSGKIVERDESPLFEVSTVTANGQRSPLVFVDGISRLQIAPNQRVNLALEYRPLFPAPAGRVENLAATQVVEAQLTSRLVVEEAGYEPVTIPLAGRVETRARLIHPLVSSLAPLVVVARRDSGVEVECTVWDPNLDLTQASYLFLDRQGKSIGQPVSFSLESSIRARGVVPGQSFTIVQRFTGNSRLVDVHRVQVTLSDREGSETMMSGEIDRVPGRVVNVSAATFVAAGLARESITSAFGTGLATAIEVATGPVLPTTLAGSRVLVRDQGGVDREAPLFFVAPSQVNYLIPAATRRGPAQVTIVRQGEVIATGTVEIEGASPGLFTANATGQGVASAQVVRVAADGSLQYAEVASFDAARRQMISRPVELGKPGETVYLVLYGTGIRYRRSLEEVKLVVGGLTLPVLYAGPQPQFIGVDQVNLLLPKELTARGEVDMQLFVEGKASNRVVIHLR